MAQSMTTVIALQQIQALREKVHWFCPRVGFHDLRCFYQEDIDGTFDSENIVASVDRIKEVDAAISRKATVFEALQIFAFDGKDAAQYQEWLEQRLSEQMSQCDVCIREFHRGRKAFNEQLTDVYDEDEVHAFLERFDKLNLKRIKAGLALAVEELNEMPSELRKAPNLSPRALYAIFETFACRAMYDDDELLSQHFDEPFELVQTNKFIKLSSYTPGMTSFLFGRNPTRSWWATRSCEKSKRNVLASEFEWSMCQPLLSAMGRVQMHALEKEFLPQFWDGVRTVVLKLDRQVITHSLRAMNGGGIEADVCRLALNHLQIDSNGLKGLLATIMHILKVSPADFWEAMGTISPISWIDQFFSSPALERLLTEASKEKISDSPALEALFGWIIPFLSSIKPINQAPACRSLLNRLLDTFQTDSRPQVVKTHCFRLGLHVLGETFRSLNCDKSLSSSGIASAEAFEIAEQHISRIAPFAKKTSSMVAASSDVFCEIIALDCKCIVTSFALLASDKPTQQIPIIYHPSTWKHAAKSVDPGNVILAKRLLLGTKSLVGLEKFVTKTDQQMPPGRAQFNTTFEALGRSMCDIIEKLNDFRPADMESFFSDAESTDSMIALLFASEARIRDAGVELIKTMSGQSTRREAVHHLLREHLHDVLNALSRSFQQIAHKKAFAPASSMLRLCTDIIDALFDSQDGLLRSENLSTRNARVIEQFWQALWQILTMIFQNTERWSSSGHEKLLLMDFCRSAMDFADNLFDQFGVLKGALQQAVGSGTETLASSGKRLLEQPKIATTAIVRWLKLRDEFLVAKSCALVCKLLVRLKEFETELPEEALEYIVQIAYSSLRTTLTNQQKAELLRALEQHAGQSLIVPDTTYQNNSRTESTKNKEVIDLEQRQSNAKASGIVGDPWSTAVSAASPTFERLRAQQALKKASAKPSPKQVLTSSFKTIDASDFRKKRQQDMEEMRKKNSLAIAAQKKRIAGEGSGLQGLGLHGKDHTVEPKGTGMMVSSDEESDDGDDSMTELDRELFGNGSKGTRKMNTINLTDEQAKALKQRQGPVKKQRLVRSAKDMRARLAPDLSPLHKSLLAWEYFHDGGFPPHTSAQDYAAVANSFRDPLSYQRTFQPLLLLEAWNGFLKAREENTARPYEIKIVNRSSVDAFLEISSTMSPADGKEISEGDIILLSKAKLPATTQNEPHCLSRVFRITRKKGLLEILYRVVPGTSLVPSLVPNTLLYGLKITSIVPLEREYGALLGLQYYDLCDEISRATPSPLLTYSDTTLQSFIETYTVNKAQAKAVKCAIDNDGFTLVQGPPGSGKTKTIVAIVGALLSSSLGGKGLPISQPSWAHSGTLSKKMLVCAPSNAAVDELVMRFKDGIKTLSNEHRNVNIVRLGRSDAINANVVDVTLEELVNKRLNITPGGGNVREETHQAMEEHKVISEKLRNVRLRMDEAEEKGGPSKELKEEFDTLRRQKTSLGQKVDVAKDNENIQSREAELSKRRAQQQIIDEAHVICATLSGSGHDMFQSMNVEFETVIIDEAAQCVELSALIPLKYGCAKCILVGDPQQLPPTVFSREAARFKYEQSLFVRMQVNRPNDVHLLDTQYRMHPEISLFPSKTFYNSRLLDGKNMGPLRTRPWHGTTLLSPFRFFDVQGQHQAASTGHSLINRAEINIAMLLYRRLMADFRDYNLRGKVGIITPYKSQLRELKEQFRIQLGQEISDAIEFNTTDAFQGREAEIIIFSCVRASPSGGIGFLQDIRRMNVGLTRAKCSLWVLGNSQSLMKGEFWAKLVEDAMARDRYTSGDLQSMLAKTLQMSKLLADGSTNNMSIDEHVRLKSAEHRHVKRDDKIKIETAVKHELDSAAAMVKNEPRRVSTASSGTNSNDHMKKEHKANFDKSVSKLLPNAVPLRPTKRKLSIDTKVEHKPRIKESTLSTTLKRSDDSDIEMADAPASLPPSAVESAYSTKHSTMKNLSTKALVTSTVARPGATVNKGSNNAVGNTVRKTTAPPPKKKPADPFIRKKPRP